MEGTTTKQIDTDKMHELPVEKALLYWIPSILVATGMSITLLCSFWKFHKRKMFIRQLQLDYMEVNLDAKRPRIGAIRCNTHGAKWDDLMASLSFNNSLPVRQLSQIKSFRHYGTLYEQSEASQSNKSYSIINEIQTKAHVHNDKEKDVNVYYEQRGYINNEIKVKKEKKKKKKRNKAHIRGGTYAFKHETGDNVDVNTEHASSRSLPVIENHLWKGYSDTSPGSTEVQSPSFYFSRSFLHHYDSKLPSPQRSELDDVSKSVHDDSKHRQSADRSQEERVFWVLATDIQQSSV